MNAKKRGLSPVIATILLIAIALVLAAIIFLWARGFLAEKLQKDLGEGPEPIEVVCEKVDFDGEARIDLSNKLYLTAINKGNIPIYGLIAKKKSRGSLTLIQELPYAFTTSLLSGETASISTTSVVNILPDESLVIVPVILGESGEQTKAYPCEKKSLEIAEKDIL